MPRADGWLLLQGERGGEEQQAHGEHQLQGADQAVWGQPPGCVCSQDEEVSWDCVKAECRSIPEGSAAASQRVPVGVV